MEGMLKCDIEKKANLTSPSSFPALGPTWATVAVFPSLIYRSLHSQYFLHPLHKYRDWITQSRDTGARLSARVRTSKHQVLGIGGQGDRSGKMNQLAMAGGASQIKMPTKEELTNLTKDERLQQAAQADKAAQSALSMVENLRSKAAAFTDPAKREKMLSEAYDREIEARGLSKKARILKSGTFQGALAGGGIGAGSAMGLGTVVGTLVGGVASIPTTLVGTLVGAGTGAIHGPWIKLGLGKDEKGEEKEETLQVPQQVIDSGAVVINESNGQVKVNDPDALKKAVAAQGGKADTEKKSSGDAAEKRKPPKLGPRTNKAVPAEESKQLTAPSEKSTGKAVPSEESTKKNVASDASKPKKKPPKLGPRQKKAA